MAPAVVLIGPPGSGKSTVAKALAFDLGIDYADSDALVEQRVGKSVADIFLEDGEPAFRAWERSVVHDALASVEGVLALGGGAPMIPAVAEELSACPAPIIFLDVSIKAAAPRVGFNSARPLLLGNPRRQWMELMERRRPTYEGLADYRIATDEKSPAAVAREIVTYLTQHSVKKAKDGQP